MLNLTTNILVLNITKMRAKRPTGYTDAMAAFTGTVWDGAENKQADFAQQVRVITTGPSATWVLSGRLGTGTTFTDLFAIYADGKALITGDLNHSGSKVGFYNATPVARNGTPFTLNGGATASDVPNGTATVLDLEKVLRQLLLYLGDTSGNGLINVTA